MKGVIACASVTKTAKGLEDIHRFMDSSVALRASEKSAQIQGHTSGRLDRSRSATHVRTFP